jgi:probable phosphomutase (TIGR03848 family)
VPTLLLVRHGRSTANTAGVLAGRSEGVSLDDRGRTQASDLAGRMAPLPIASIVSSPIQRCLETAQALREVPGPRGRYRTRPEIVTDARLSEVDYGDWTNRKLSDLAREPLWRVVQGQPSAVTFPAGESLRAMQARAVDAVREHDDRVRDQAGESAIWVAVSHGDVIKALLADALGLHLDGFQRIVVDPCSVSVVRYGSMRPFVVRTNDTGADLAPLVPPARRRRPRADAVVGGGAGSE